MGFQFGTKTKQAGQENSTPSLRKTVRPFDSVRPTLRSQRTIGNEDVSEKPGTPLGIGDFRSPVTSARSRGKDSRFAHSFATVRIFPISARIPTRVRIPRAGVTEEEQVIRQPPAPAPGPAPAGPLPAAAESCAQPRSMHKVTSGPFLGGLTMDSYFPDLVGRGFYDHPGTAGPFDTGRRAGANVQLFGVIPSPCLPAQFRLEQMVTATRARVNGTALPEEGTTFDDIATSGRDATRPPFRQEFLGGGAAPLGYIISMADPPSAAYGPRLDVDFVDNFVTSLIGPGGRQSVSWSRTVQATGGRVTRNTVS
jgi:hypothetical protein